MDSSTVDRAFSSHNASVVLPDLLRHVRFHLHYFCCLVAPFTAVWKLAGSVVALHEATRKTVRGGLCETDEVGGGGERRAKECIDTECYSNSRYHGLPHGAWVQAVCSIAGKREGIGTMFEEDDYVFIIPFFSSRNKTKGVFWWVVFKCAAASFYPP